jgi:mycofactocin precursor
MTDHRIREVFMTPTATESRTDTVVEPPASPSAQAPHDDEVLAELLVEEISIDGMCGVY